MHEIPKIFNQFFQTWKIVLPPEALETRQRGELHGSGWTIQYLFGQDEQGEYLDFYATHRMTNDRHMRIYTTGEVISLEAPLEFMVFPQNSTEEEQERIREQYYSENRRIYNDLHKKGFH